jgi:hypothetical protein
MVMPKARIKDIEMYYEVHGTGTPLVHIGGLAGDARAWARQIELAQNTYLGAHWCSRRHRHRFLS